MTSTNGQIGLSNPLTEGSNIQSAAVFLTCNHNSKKSSFKSGGAGEIKSRGVGEITEDRKFNTGGNRTVPNNNSTTGKKYLIWTGD